SRQLARQFLKGYAMTSPSAMDEIVAGAMAGWHDAFEALEELRNEFHACGQQLPPQFALSTTLHAWGRHSNRGGRRKSDHVTRNLAYALVIDALCKHFGLRATRHKLSRTKRDSASSVLALALKEELPDGLFKPGVRAIEGTWEKFGPKL